VIALPVGSGSGGRLPSGMLAATPLSMSRLSLLIDLASLLGREVDLDTLLATACERMAESLRADRASIWLVDAERGDLVTRVALLPEVPELRQPMGQGLAGHVARTGETVRVDEAASDPRFDPSADRATGYHTQSMLVAAIREHGRAPVRGVIQLLNRKDGPFDSEDERYLEALAQQLARALSLTTLRAPDESGPGLMLRGPFNRIVGRSAAMRKVYQRVGLAAQTDATVLLRGETGTGKGLFARAIHVNSPRQGGPFVTVDCTTLPAQLVESELFGHERGAFTGAERRVRGKVELAHEGTLFLDEIGELPPEMQGKLLRFLQERSYERVGGRETLRADVRVVCATHRDLEKLVAEGKFPRRPVLSHAGGGDRRAAAARAWPRRGRDRSRGTSPRCTPIALWPAGAGARARGHRRAARVTGSRATCASSSTGSRARWCCRPTGGSPTSCGPSRGAVASRRPRAPGRATPA
jgi:transcriptional regulator with GAF, ATPase, and Fis domain